MKIYTLTLNPAFDIHTEVENLKLNKENFAIIRSREAGGKGLNISRALTCAGIKNSAVVLLGKENAEDYLNLVTSVNIMPIYRDGRIRENITIHSNGNETRISFSGLSVSDDVFSEILEKTDIDGSTILTFTGSLPDGISVKAAKNFLMSAKSLGAKIVIDSRSFSLQDILDIGPWLIKPNEEEINKYCKEEIKNLQAALKKAEEILKNGVENVIISLGASGAVLACKDGSCIINAPKIDVLSTIGAGDSMIAGFISAYIKNLSCIDLLKYAVAYGSAACLTRGTNPPKAMEIEKMMD